MMNRKKGFTMVEIIIVIMIISTALITIISSVTKTTRYISEMRQRTIAMNLAKEGIEAMYNIRNTNRRRRSSQRDQCWLKANPMEDKNGDGCENDTWMTQGRWVINKNDLGNFFLQEITNKRFGEWIALNVNYVKNGRYKRRIKQYISPAEEQSNDPHNNYKMHFVNGKWISHDKFKNLENPDENTSLGTYWRFIAIDGLYPKGNKNPNDSQYANCESGKGNGNCGDSKPKELRFCSTVVYSKPYQGIVNICAIMTNFIE